MSEHPYTEGTEHVLGVSCSLLSPMMSGAVVTQGMSCFYFFLFFFYLCLPVVFGISLRIGLYLSRVKGRLNSQVTFCSPCYPQWTGREQQQCAGWTCSGFWCTCHIETREVSASKKHQWLSERGGGSSRVGKQHIPLVVSKTAQGHISNPPPSPDLYKWAARPVSKTWWTNCGSSIALCWSQTERKELQGVCNSPAVQHHCHRKAQLASKLTCQRLGEMEVTDLYLCHWWVGDLGACCKLLCSRPQLPRMETCLGALLSLTSVPGALPM